MIKSSSFDIQIISDRDNILKPSAVSCKLCQSRVHDYTQCTRGSRCKICCKTGHETNNCIYIINSI